MRYSGAPHTVTLVSGDRVSVAGDGAVRIERGKGRERVRFLTRRVGGHLHVIPADALPLIRADRLDDRLFDVTVLMDNGYDERRTDTPLLFVYSGESLRSMPAAKGARVTHELPALNAQAVRASKDTTLWTELTGDSGRLQLSATSPVAKVWLDGLRRTGRLGHVPAGDVGSPYGRSAGVHSGQWGVDVPIRTRGR